MDFVVLLLAAGLFVEFGSQLTAWLDQWTANRPDLATRMTGATASLCYMASLVPFVTASWLSATLTVGLIAFLGSLVGRRSFSPHERLWFACLFLTGMVGMFSGPSGGAGGLRTWLAGNWHLAAPEIESWVFAIRKTVHVTAYGSIALAVASLMRRVGSGRFGVWPALAWVASLACFDEFRQSFTPGRTGQFMDVLIDLTGATACLAILQLFKRPVPSP